MVACALVGLAGEVDLSLANDLAGVLEWSGRLPPASQWVPSVRGRRAEAAGRDVLMVQGHRWGRASSEARAIRARAEALDDAIDRASAARPIAAARRLVQVYNGGAIPTAAGYVYLTNPVELDGAETEGGPATVNADATATLPVVVLENPAVAGDVLVASAVGGRWVADKGKPPAPSGVPCGTCTIPAANLTVSWTNPILGDGSAPLVYSSGPTTWLSACTNELLFELLCNQGQVEFRVTYYLSGSCPSGQSQYASTLRNNPYKLTRTGLVCGSSFLMTVSLSSTSCPVLWSYGYAGFTISK